jgi:hypothetical protein
LIHQQSIKEAQEKEEDDDVFDIDSKKLSYLQ